MGTQGKIRVYSREVNTKEEREAVASGKKKKPAVTWSYSIEAGRDPSTGKRRRVTKHGFKSQREARAAAQPVLNKMMLGQNIVESDITFADYADDWFKEYQIDKKRKTIDNAVSIMKIAKHYFNNVKIKDISTYSYQQMINTSQREHGYYMTQRIKILIDMILRSALKYNFIRRNPSEGVNIPRPKTRPIDVTSKYLTKEELQSFLNTASLYCQKRHLYFYPMCVLLAYTGMRLGEASALIWSNIDFKQKIIHVESTLYTTYSSKGYEWVRQSTPKTISSIRDIPASDYLLSILKKWKVQQKEYRLLHRLQNNSLITDDFVFTRKVKDIEYPINGSCFNGLCYRISEQCSIFKHIHAHIFRHTHASLLAETGQVSLEEIQERLGHTNDNTTRMIYLHVTEKRKRDVAQIFDAHMENWQQNGNK